jgi:hypothetical protein
MAVIKPEAGRILAGTDCPTHPWLQPRGTICRCLPVWPDRLAAEIEKAARADCRKAYAGAGLLAMVPLAIDAMGGTAGCKG